jgi:hypothetical protein
MYYDEKDVEFGNRLDQKEDRLGNLVVESEIRSGPCVEVSYHLKT